MVGISFHVGSGCMDPPAYAKAIQAARKLFDFAEQFGYNFNLLDIGGGFPGDTNTDIKEVRKYSQNSSLHSEQCSLSIRYQGMHNCICCKYNAIYVS